MTVLARMYRHSPVASLAILRPTERGDSRCRLMEFLVLLNLHCI